MPAAFIWKDCTTVAPQNRIKLSDAISFPPEGCCESIRASPTTSMLAIVNCTLIEVAIVEGEASLDILADCQSDDNRSSPRPRSESRVREEKSCKLTWRCIIEWVRDCRVALVQGVSEAFQFSFESSSSSKLDDVLTAYKKLSLKKIAISRRM